MLTQEVFRCLNVDQAIGIKIGRPARTLVELGLNILLK